MSRIARAIAPGFPHHVVQRGNNKDQVFFDREDRRRYLSLLRKYAKKWNAPVLAYCLMSNHVHLKYGRTGRLWESRYHSCIVEEERYLWAAVRYIEQNPVRARIVKKLEEYLYSGARAHVTGKRNPVLGEELFSPEDRGNYVSLLGETLFPALIEEMRYQTRRGTPLGAEDFVEGIEAKLGRSLVRKPRGRPKRGME